ncbi:hypothetical protein [Gottfriedia luciferensis]|uniref:hypothetical protein n=1 Tax=Gottfriedia luciferensis TaxID=178774 RepID=UPI000B446A21|nr:hypothetical protein [Gottfriedia luciferensis]
MGWVNRKQIVYFLLGASFILLLSVFIHTEKKKIQYEHYLSNVVSNQIASISQSSLYNLGILQEVIKNKKLTKEQAGELQLSFNQIVSNTQDMASLGEAIGKLKDYNISDILDINSKYAFYFYYLLKQDLVEQDEINLTNEKSKK